MRALIHSWPMLLTSILFGCTTGGAGKPQENTRPDDFSVEYEWREGSVPPPYHYEYNIMDALYRLMVENGMFTCDWRRIDSEAVGGSRRAGQPLKTCLAKRPSSARVFRTELELALRNQKRE